MRPPLMMPHPAGPVVLTPPGAVSCSGSVVVSELRIRFPVFSAGSNLSPAPAQKSTTLYIGKIATSVSEETIQTLLEACGPVKSWKPMQDPETNKSKGFGFCEYQDAEGVLRALRLLHNLALDGQELLLKCNTATQRYIDDYQANKQRQAEQKKQETKPTDDSSDSKPDVKAEQESTDDQQDDDILAKIMALVSDRAAQHASSTAADQATDFLKDVLPPPPSRERRPQPSSSKDRSYTSRERERGSSTERNAERQFERERQREKRELEIRQADLERAYQKKLREWEQVERYTFQHQIWPASNAYPEVQYLIYCYPSRCYSKSVFQGPILAACLDSRSGMHT